MADLSKWVRNLKMAYAGMGMVYGSLATTPLYLYSALPSPPSSSASSGQEEHYYYHMGLFSTIFWILTFLAALKSLLLLLLHAHDSGPGGIFELYSLLCKHLRVLEKEEESIIQQGRRQKLLRNFLFCVTMLATCMLFGDGIITPSISVLSALEGIEIIHPSIGQVVIKLMSVLLLIGLFLIQKLNIKLRISILSPIIIMWLLATTFIGVYNILLYFPRVLKAISPYYMLKFLSIYGKKSWLAVGASTLCLTGVEIVFMHTDYLNKPSMQLGYCLAIYPSNIITYAGIIAYLITNPSCQSQAFYKFIPISLLWPMLALSTLAALVASQGLILACFNIIKHCVESDYFPMVQITHTSKEQEGQVYSEQVNYTLMVFCIAVTIGFQNGNALSNVYGVMVLVIMTSLTLSVTMIMLLVWKVSVPIVVAFILFFGLWEACSLLAMLSEVPKGGFLLLLLPLIPIILVCAWLHKCNLRAHYELLHSRSIPNFNKMLQLIKTERVPGICLVHTFSHSLLEIDAISPSNGMYEHIHDTQGNSSVTKGLDHFSNSKEPKNPSSMEEFDSVSHTKDNGTQVGALVPPLLEHYVQTTRSLHRVVVLTCFHITRVPEVPKASRFRFTLPMDSTLLSSGLYTCTVQIGYADPTAGLMEELLEHLQQFIEHEMAALSADTCAQLEDGPDDIREACYGHVAEIERTKADMDGLTCHMLGKPQLKLVTKSNFLQRFIVNKLYPLLEFHDPILSLLSEVPLGNLLQLNLTYEVEGMVIESTQMQHTPRIHFKTTCNL